MADVRFMNGLWIGLGCIVIAILMGIHQYLLIRKFVHMSDILHHETFMAFFGALGVGIILGAYLQY